MIKLHKSTNLIPKGTPYTTLPVFINNNSYYLTDLTIYKNGYIDCWEIVSLDEFIEKVAQGWVTVELDRKTQDISIHGVGEIAPGYQYLAYKTNQDLILEVKDLIAELNKQPTSSQRCFKAWQQYQKQPSQQHKAVLKEAYEAIPTHNRMYVLGDQDRKDRPIRQVIYSEEPTFFDAFFDMKMTDLPINIIEKPIQSFNQQGELMQELEYNLQQVRTIKQRYEEEIQQFLQQKIDEFHQEVNLPIQYCDIDLDSEEEDGVYTTQIKEFKLNIHIEL